MIEDRTESPRPLSIAVPPHIATRTRTQLALAAAQAHWDLSVPRGPVMRDDVAEELPSKAEANRARVAFLAHKGATMKGWLAHCAAGTDVEPDLTEGR
jgi:hypothetical protein